MGWPDLEAALCDLLATEQTTLKGALTRPPSNLATQMPLAVVARFGGGYDGLALDEANLDVDWYAATREAALTLAGAGHLYLVRLRNVVFGDAHVITRVVAQTSPMRRPYDSKNQVHRIGAAYRATVHVNG